MNGLKNKQRKSEQHVTPEEREDSATWMGNRIRTFGRKSKTLHCLEVEFRLLIHPGSSVKRTESPAIPLRELRASTKELVFLK